MIVDERIIGVGSMCRRAVGGDDGIVSIVDALHRRLPRGIRLHLFGLKSDGAECVADLDGRVASIDSQAYGFRARAIANERRKADPSFSQRSEERRVRTKCVDTGRSRWATCHYKKQIKEID